LFKITSIKIEDVCLRKFFKGIIFLGVLDNGEVNGIMMSPWQQQHFVLNVQETFQRFAPKVPDHFYKIQFVPVVEPGIQLLLSFFENCHIATV